MFRGELPLHDHVRFPQRQAWVTKQASENRPGTGKRQVGDDHEWLTRPGVLDSVALNNLDGLEVAEARTKLSSQRLIAFDHDHASPGAGEHLGEHTRAAADLNYEIAEPEPRFGDKVGC